MANNRNGRPPKGRSGLPPITKIKNIFRLIVVANIAVVCLAVSIVLSVFYINYHSQLNSGTIALFIVLLAILAFVFVFFFVSFSKDGMTGVPNADSLYLFQIRKIVFKQLPEYCALYINLKNFKFVNRLVENTGGDIVLIKYTKAIKKYLMPGEIIARLGGDNFMVMIYQNRVKDFLEFVECIDIHMNIEGVDNVIPIYSRVGVYPLKEGDNIGDIMGNTSIAMNNAKSGRVGDIVWFSEEMKEEHFREKSILYAFRSALEQKEFKVYYQPKVDIETGCLCGCEALARWEKDGKILPPIAFVPALEKNKRIGALDFYVLEAVCQDIVNWTKMGIEPVRVSLNISKTQLTDSRLAEKILAIIKKYKVDKKYIQIELTESADVEDYGHLTEFLEKMKREDISTALDDFGIGYSSLELIKNVNIDVIKIDKSFIDHIEDNNGENDHAYLVHNIINSCFDLRKEIVCEGVESLEQKELLKKMHCKVVQGYLYDKPLPIEEFENRLRAKKYE